MKYSRGLVQISSLPPLTGPERDARHNAEYAGHLVLLFDGRVEAAGSPAAVLTEDLIARVYAAQVTVSTDRAVTPWSPRSASRRPPARSPRKFSGIC